LKTTQYAEVIDKHKMKTPYLRNMAYAFFFGGLICLVGQTFQWIYINIFNVEKQTAATYMVVSMIFLSAFFTALGIYDKFGQHAKAGGFIPITGFANSMTCSALEGRSEGIILGIAANMFKLAGGVLVIAVISGFVFGIIRYFLMQLGIAPELDPHTVSTIIGGIL